MLIWKDSEILREEDNFFSIFLYADRNLFSENSFFGISLKVIAFIFLIFILAFVEQRWK